MSFVFGVPRMRKEAGERRDFLPKLVKTMLETGCEVQLERGVGSGLGLTDADYTSLSERVRLVDHATAWRADLVLVLRSPDVEEYERLMRRGSTVMAMLHFPTRPQRVAKLRELGVEAVSLDSITSDAGVRLVEYTESVGWSGVEAAFEALWRFAPWRVEPGKEPIHVTVFGSGLVGRHAVDAATKYGRRERFTQWGLEGRPPVQVTVVGRALMRDEAWVHSLLRQTDVLVDASQRADSSLPLVPNAWLKDLPEHAVLCDLVVDPYVLAGVPPTVRSIEGIPQGNLDQYIFPVDDPAWSTLPPAVAQQFRRTTVSCYSWPGIYPRQCMDHYGRQLAPLLKRLIEVKGGAGLAPEGDAIARALWRGSLQEAIAEQRRRPRPSDPGDSSEAVSG